MDMGEVLYILFRHKWKILSLSVLSVAAALCVPFVRPVVYQSEARLWIRYVVDETPTQAPGSGGSRITTPDLRAEGIINTELQILTSRDIAQQVAKEVGPEKILGQRNLPDASLGAAVAIQKGLKAEAGRSSSVIVLTFQHRDPEVAQGVLKSLIASYLKMHEQFHGVGAFDEFLRKEVDQRHSRVVQLEDELRAAKSKLGIISLADTMGSLATQMSALQQRLVDTEGDLAQERAALTEMLKSLPAGAAMATNAAGATNLVQSVPTEKTEEYRNACALVDSGTRRVQELLLTFTANNSMVKHAQEQLATHQALKQRLETEHPGLLATPLAATPAQGNVNQEPRLLLNTQIARVSGLESRAKLVKEQLAQVQARVAEVTAAEGNISDLQSRLSLEQTNYFRFLASLEQSQMDERIGRGKVSNISSIQDPSAPLKAPSKLFKIMALVALGGIGASFGLAFLIELYLDPSVKRAADVETKLRLPLFISVHMLNGNGKAKALPAPRVPLLSSGQPSGHAQPSTLNPQQAGDSQLSTLNSQLTLAPWDAHHGLHPYSEALRDRLMTYFEVNGMTHKPKLVAVTGCGHGAGVSTIAAGLAASFSETGEGNVLLVDMNVQNGAAHRFRRGEIECGIDEALERGKRDNALVQDNLYVVSEGQSAENLPSVLPTRFKGLVPKLKASDYDYIIFDMPPVSQVSLTPRLSKFMDMVLMVVEAEKTDQQVVRRASALISESQPNIGIVLNKTKTYVPKGLKQDF